MEKELGEHAGLALAGNAYHGVGIGDCIHSGERAAEKILDDLAARSKNKGTGEPHQPSDA